MAPASSQLPGPGPRGHKLCPCPADCDCRSLFPGSCKCSKHPLPGYVLTNLSGNIKRNRDRLARLVREQEIRRLAR